MLKFYKTILSILIINIVIVGYMFSADAANQGLLGITSTASFSLEPTVVPEVLITGLTNISFGQATIAPNGTFNNLSRSDTFCVYSNTGAYDVEVSGNNSFQLLGNNNGELIPITLTYSGISVPSSPHTIQDRLGNSSSKTCGGSTNAILSISVYGADIQNVSSDNYTETIHLLISPSYYIDNNGSGGPDTPPGGPGDPGGGGLWGELITPIFYNVT